MIEDTKKGHSNYTEPFQEHEQQDSFSSQYEEKYNAEHKRIQREAREAREAAEIRERDRIRGIFAGTGINGKI